MALASNPGAPGARILAGAAPNSRRLARGVAAACVAVFAIALLGPWAIVEEGLRASVESPGVLLAVAGAYSLAFVLRAISWRVLIKGRARTVDLFANLQTGLWLNHALPFRPGEVARPLLATKRGMGLDEAVASSVAARALDFVSLAVIAAAAMPAIATGGGAGAAGPAVIGGSLAAGPALLALRGVAIPAWVPRPVGQRAAAFQAALAAIPLGRLARALPLVTASWLLEASVLLGGAHLLDVDLSLRLAVGVTAFTIIFQVFHVTPGGVGVYETAMSTALTFSGVAPSEALALAILTHTLKFAYSFSVGSVFAAREGLHLLRGRAAEPKRASRFEIVAARTWNLVNEGKPFTPIFLAAVLATLWVVRGAPTEGGGGALIALAAVAPAAVVFYFLDFPLRLRAALWAYLAAFMAVTGGISVEAVVVTLVLYFGFTVGLWGTVYYHLRIGTPWTNGLRFARLVVENPDPTSANFLEQVPKLLLLVALFDAARTNGAGEAMALGAGVAAVTGISGLLLHQWFFTWVPPVPQPGLGDERRRDAAAEARASRVVVVVIDGCRADRLEEADTPFLDSLGRAGLVADAMTTVYPARTVTCFSSMLTGAPPAVHGLRSNFVPSLGVKCESVFDVLRAAGMRGKLVSIAHLVDAFGERDVVPVTAVADNDEIDAALVATAKRVALEEQPELLVLHLLSVDQTGHARGSYNDEYLKRIEATDRVVEEFVRWCTRNGYEPESTLFMVTADHGQGRGIGGHGHLTRSERRIPFMMAGGGTPRGAVLTDPCFITDIADTVTGALGLRRPASSCGRDLVAGDARGAGPVVFVIPARDEEERIGGVLEAVTASGIEDATVIVVDDGSRDGTAAVAQAAGARVVSHGKSRGLGAALRTGLAAARSLQPRAVVYLDGDGEYDAREARNLLAPIEEGLAEYVVGRRMECAGREMTHARRLANRAFSAMLSVCCRRWISDGQSGFRALSPTALVVAEIVHDYNYAQVLTMDLLRKGMRMKEVPVTYRRRRGGRSFVTPGYLWRVPAGMVREMIEP